MDKYEIPNLGRACKMLSFLNASGRSMSCLEISRAMGLPRTTVFRILETFRNAGFLETDGKKYFFGKALVQIGNAARLRVNIGEMSRPFLKKITEQTGETSHIGVLRGDRVLIAKICESPLALHAASREGSIVELHCSGTGKILLAEIFAKEPGFIKSLKLERRTKNTITSLSELKRELKMVLSNGYSLDDEEYHDSIRCMAVPLHGPDGELLASLGITAPAVRFQKKDIPKFYSLLSSVSKEFSSKIALSSDVFYRAIR